MATRWGWNVSYTSVSINRTRRRRVNVNVFYISVSSSSISLSSCSIVTLSSLLSLGRCISAASCPGDCGWVGKGTTECICRCYMCGSKSLEEVAVKKVMVASDSVNVALFSRVPVEGPLHLFLVVGGDEGSKFVEA